MRRCAQKEELSPAEKAKRVKKRTDGVKNIADNLQSLRRKLNQELNSGDEKERLVALVISVMDKTAERVGNEESAENNHLGVTGFKKKNISVEGNTVKLSYTGKSGVKHEKDFTDKKLAPMISDLLKQTKGEDSFVFETPDGFKIKSDQVTRFLKPFDIKPKDIRGYAANRYMIRSLKRRGIEPDEKERKKRFLETLKDVAERVGHTPSMLRNSYLLPDLEDKYIKHGKVVELDRKASIDEKAIIARLMAPPGIGMNQNELGGEARPKDHVVDNTVEVRIITFDELRDMMDRLTKSACLYYAGIEDVLKKYSQKNKAWYYDKKSQTFTADASDLGRGTWKDPWNRSIRDSWISPIRDREGDIQKWTGHTTVKGEKINLTIFND